MGLSHTADHALSYQLAQPVDWVDDVEIALESRAIEVDRDMAHQDVVGRHESGQETTFGATEAERLVAAPDQCGAGYDCQPPLRQWRTKDERLNVKGGTRSCNHGISCRLRYVLKSRHHLTSA